MADDDVAADLLRARAKVEEEYERRIAAIDGALEALGINAREDGRWRRPTASVGADKVEAVRAYVRRMGEVRQADIAQELKMNTGTVSTALDALEAAGEVERGSKVNRSRMVRAV